MPAMSPLAAPSDHFALLVGLQLAYPRHEKAFFNLAIVSDELGRGEEALAAMVQAARLGSKDAREALRARGLRW